MEKGVQNYLVVIRINMSFDPSDPAVTEEIINQVSTMLGNDIERKKIISEQQKKSYIQSQANEIFKAYNQQVSVVGQTELNDLNIYYTLLTNQQSTVSSAISTLSDQLANTELVEFSSFSTLLTMPYVPTSLKEYFGK